MITLVQGSIVERVQQLTLGSGLQITQDTDGLATLDTNPASFMTQAQADLRYAMISHTHAATDIVSGTLADARLSTNIPRLNTSQTWTALQIMQIDGESLRIRANTASAANWISYYNSTGARRGYLGFSVTSSPEFRIVNEETTGDVVIYANTQVRLTAKATGGGTLAGTWATSALTNTVSSGAGLSLIKGGDANRNFLRWNQGSATWQAGFRASPYSWVLEYQLNASPADDTGWTQAIVATTAGAITMASDVTSTAGWFIASNTKGLLVKNNTGSNKIAMQLDSSNTWQVGDGLTFALSGAVTINAAIPTAIAIVGSVTTNPQIAIGSSSVWGVHGAEFSSGYQCITYNAYQNTYSTDSWTQSLSSSASGLFEVRDNGLVFFTAAAGKAVGNKATFWTSRWSMISGNMSLYPTSTTPSTPSSYAIYIALTGSEGTARLTLGADTSYGYIQSWGGQPLFLNQQGNHIYAGSWLVFAQNYGHGLVGSYDASKYRLIYAIGTSYLPAAAGTSITGSYGLFFVHDGTINISGGYTLGHSIAVVANGSVRSMLGESGVWCTAGAMWAPNFVLI